LAARRRREESKGGQNQKSRFAIKGPKTNTFFSPEQQNCGGRKKGIGLSWPRSMSDGGERKKRVSRGVESAGESVSSTEKEKEGRDMAKRGQEELVEP